MVYSRYMDYKNQHLILGQKVIRWELSLALICTLVVAVVTRNYNSIISAFLGGVLVLVPTLIYVYIAFRKGVIAYPGVALGRHQQAMVLRFVVNFVLFALVVIIYRQCNFLLLLISYFVTLSGYWLSLVKF